MAAPRQPGSTTASQRTVAAPPQTERLGKYEIVKHIATGGMAEIHLARATGIEGFEKWVVLKRILPQFSTNQEFVQMFLDEARIAATLHHPNIVQVYDIGSVRGQYFFAMEFLQGEDVRRIMETVISAGREMPVEHAINIIIGVCNGLHYAHDKTGIHGEPLNLVHRDVSPQNVFVTFDGGVKLVDFGIAKASNRLTETRQGTLKGKLSYMSPEQCKGDGIDRRSDVFALAIMLWELTTSKRLYRGPSEFEIMKMIIEADAPLPTVVRPGYSPDLERIVMKGLARNPDERYQSVQEMQIDLEEFAREYKLAVSSMNMARFMRELFSAKISEWANAQREGKFASDTGSRPVVALPPAEAAPSLSDHPSLDNSVVISPVTRTRGNESQIDSLIISRSNKKTIAIATSVALALMFVVGAFWFAQPSRHTSSVEVVETVATPPAPQPGSQLPPKSDLHASVTVPSKPHPAAHQKIEEPPKVGPHVARSTSIADDSPAEVVRHVAPVRAHHESVVTKPATEPKSVTPTTWDDNSAVLPE